MIRSFLLGLVWLASTYAMANEPVSTGFWSNTAIDGHDTVAYHQSGLSRSDRLVEGNKRYTVTWNGANWYFASQASADRFAKHPKQYAPSYNGFCANALSIGQGKIRTDGTIWEFFGGKLYLFYAKEGRQRWLNGDWKAYKTQADNAWRKIISKK